MDFRTFWSKMAAFWGAKIGEGVVRVQHWPPANSFWVLGVVTSVPLLSKIDQSIALPIFVLKAPLNESKRSIALTIILPCCLKLVAQRRHSLLTRNSCFFACSGARRASWLQDGTEVLHVGVSVWPCVGILQPGTDACHGNWGVEKLSHGNRGFCSSLFRFLPMFDFKILLCFL